MLRYLQAATAAALLLAPLALAGGKNKDKPILPAYILRARTVAVVVDPEAGISPQNPLANQTAQKDVETALLNWGRFEPHIGTEEVDLIIVIRRSSGKLVNATISDPRQNNRAGVINPTDDGISIGAQHGQPPGNPAPPPESQSPRPQTEIGDREDSFLVYDGSEGLNGIPGWRYTARDALKPHTVPAVAEFRKAIEEAEKAAANKPRPPAPSSVPPSSPAPAPGP